MALTDVLYRCPLCGHDPLAGRGDRAGCRACGAAFAWRDGGVRVRDAAGVRRVPLPRLVDALLTFEPSSGTEMADARVLDHGWIDEVPVRSGGALLGWRERAGRGREARMRASAEGIRLSGGGADERFGLHAVTSLQVASRALQIGVRRRGVRQVTLLDASPLRWERGLQRLLRDEWRGRGWGEIVEFQPRVTSR